MESPLWEVSILRSTMIPDKSTRFTLFATGILLMALFIIGWLLSRTAAVRKDTAPAQVVVLPPPAAPVPALPVEKSAAPSLPLDDKGKPKAAYEVITEVTLADDPANDGDTFLLKTPAGPQRFCLYFVDTVETDGGQPEATREMAAYFGFDSEEPLRALGLEAREFSLRLLRASAFRVVTRWEKNEEENAYYAFIYLKDPEKGLVNLAQWLIRYGLARIVPCTREQPDGMSADEFRTLLLEEEARSKSEAHGAWSRKTP